MVNNSFCCLVSPKTKRPLRRQENGQLKTDDGKEVFLIQNDIVMLSGENMHASIQRERDVFDGLPVKDDPYFRQEFFSDILRKIRDVVNVDAMHGKPCLRIAELGGGEGHWARSVKNAFLESEVYVCDISKNMLQRAPLILKRICADITSPIFEDASIDIAAFWVSLHHLGINESKKAIEQAGRSLKDGGLLVVFEPNDAFFLRKCMYNTRLGNDVYPDEGEKAINFSYLHTLIKEIKLTEVGKYFLNPPYNLDFVKQLKRWLLYFPVVELLYRTDKLLLSPLLGDIHSKRQLKLKKYLSLYGFSLYRKGKRL